MRDNLSITVVIVNWNSGRLLAECLLHLGAQTVQPQVILVVDNASSDGSMRAALENPNVTALQMHENLGFAAANNLAVTLCHTEFIALLNPDAFPDACWLENLLSAARAYPRVAAFGSRQLSYADPSVLDGIGDVYHCSGVVWRNRHGRQERPEDMVGGEIFSPCAAAGLYRRQAFLEVGGLDDDYFCYVEDVDLGFRLRLSGWGIRYVPEAVVRHVGCGSSGGAASDFCIYQGHRNLVWTFVKNMPGYLFWMLLPVHLLLNVFSLVYFVMKGRGNPIFQAKLDAIKGLPAAWKKRRHIQSRRVATPMEIWRVLDKQLAPPELLRKLFRQEQSR